MALTNAQLAERISDLIDLWRNREQEFQAWLAGVADGGPDGDGRYPLTDTLGVVRLTKSPARLEADVDGLVSSALVYRDDSQAAASQAADSAAAAAASAADALAQRNFALGHKDAAEVARLGAETAAANAQGQALTARRWANEEEDVVVTDGLYSARHWALKASDAYTNLQAILSDALDTAIADATAVAEAAASAAASSASAASTSASQAAASETNAATSASDAASSASAAAVSAAAAAASAAAAATFEPSLYALLAADNTFTDGRMTIQDASGVNGARLNFKTPTGDVAGYVGKASSAHDDMYVYAENNLRLYAGGIRAATLEASALTVNGSLMSSSEFPEMVLYDTNGVADRRLYAIRGGSSNISFRAENDARNVTSSFLVVQTTGAVTVRRTSLWSYDAERLAVESSRLYLGGKEAVDSADTWMRLNASGEFSSGIYTPGLMRADGGIRVSTGTHIVSASQASYTYGSIVIGGDNQGGYVGLALNDSRRLTLMSNGGAAGIYAQGSSVGWIIRDDGSRTMFGRPTYIEGFGHIPYYASTAYTGGKITVQTSGPSGTPANGDQWIQVI